MKKVKYIIIAAILLVLTLTSTMSVETTAFNNSLEYNVYNASTGFYKKSYTLAANPIIDKSRIVVGDDDRVVDFSKSGVVKIITKSFSGREYNSSGFVVDSHTIATAAHCVYDKRQGPTMSVYYGTPVLGCYIEHIYLFNADGNIAMNITDAKEVHILKRYADMSGMDAELDYALITVSEDLSAYANFNLGVPLDSFNSSGKSVSCTGFPTEVNGIEVNNASDHTMYTDTGNVVYQEGDLPYMIRYNCDTSEGNSGCPIYMSTIFDNKIYYTVVGIHTSPQDYAKVDNVATRMTTDLIHFYKNNPNITY